MPSRRRRPVSRAHRDDRLSLPPSLLRQLPSDDNNNNNNSDAATRPPSHRQRRALRRRLKRARASRPQHRPFANSPHPPREDPPPSPPSPAPSSSSPSSPSARPRPASAPRPSRNADDAEAARLEALLGLATSSTKKRRSTTYDKLFADDDDLLDLLNACDAVVASPPHPKRPRSARTHPASPPREQSSPRKPPVVESSPCPPDSDADSDADQSLPEHASIACNAAATTPTQPTRRIRQPKNAQPLNISISSTDTTTPVDPPPPITRSAARHAAASVNAVNNPQSSDEAAPCEQPFRFRRRALSTAPAAQPDAASIGRKFRGLLNRVSVANAHPVADKLVRIFEEAALHVSRRHLADIYANTALDCVRATGSVRVQNPFIAAHVAIVKYLADRVDMLVPAHFLVQTVTRLNQALAPQPTTHSNNDHSSTSLQHSLAFMAAVNSMYVQKVVSSQVVYGLVRLIASPIDETRLEILLLCLRHVGPYLRKEDPAAVKQIIQFVHAQLGSDAAPSRHEQEHNEPTTYDGKQSVLLDLLNEIKDNRTTTGRITEEDTIINAKTPSFVRLDTAVANLLDPDFVTARWWQVDAPLKPIKMSATRATEPAQISTRSTNTRLLSSMGLKSQLRQSIFHALMNSVSPSDAVKRLDTLGCVHTKYEIRDALHVILSSCAKEKAYNPFYAQVAEKLCRSRHGPFAVKAAIMQAVKSLGSGDQAKKNSNSERKAQNIALFTADLWHAQVVPLSILSDIPDLSDCSDIESRFVFKALENLFSRVLIEKQEDDSSRDLIAARTAFEKLASEKWSGATPFRLSFAAFIRRNVCPKLAMRSRKFAQSAVRVLEVGS